MIPLAIITVCSIALTVNDGEGRKWTLWLVIGLAILTLAHTGGQ